MPLLKSSVVYMDYAYIAANIKEDEKDKELFGLMLPCQTDFDWIRAASKSEAEKAFVRKYIPEWNHAFDIGFAVFTAAEDPFDATPREIIDGLERRLNELKDNPEMVHEAIGYYNDSYNNWE